MPAPVSRIAVACAFCEAPKLVTATYLAASTSGRVFCNLQHLAEWRAAQAALASPSFVCGQCGQQGLRRRLRPSRKNERFFCGPECRTLALTSAKTLKRCEVCARDMKLKPYEVGSRRVCSKECHAEWLNGRFTGANSAVWKGGPQEAIKRAQQKIRRDPDLYQRQSLRHRISAGMRHSLKRVGAFKHRRRWELLAGYTVDALRDRLLATMPAGHSWQDFLDGRLEIDHIVPVAAFRFTSPDDIDFKRCWSLDNLQLLPMSANRRKSDKIAEPFQPALPIAVC